MHQKLLANFPAASGYAIGVFLSDDALAHIDNPAKLIETNGAILVMKNFVGDPAKLHYLQVVGKSYNLLSYIGGSGSSSLRLIVADSQTQATIQTMSLKEISAWTGTAPVLVTTQGYTFGTTAKTIGRVAELTGIATAPARVLTSLPFDIGIYDATQFEGTSASDTQSYHVPLIRFFGGEHRELPDLIQPPYSLAAHDSQITGFLIPLPKEQMPDIHNMADKWTSRSNVLKEMSDGPNSALAGFVGKDIFGSLGKGTQRYHQARAVLLVVDVSLAPPVGEHRLKDITESSFSASVTHTKITGFAAPAQSHSILLDFTLNNLQPKIHQLPILHPSVAGPVTIDGIYIKTNAQDATTAAAAIATAAQNPWAQAAASATQSSANIFVTNSGIFYPYKVTPAGIGGPLPMLLKRNGDQISWTPTIADQFAKYEVRQSNFPPTSPTDGTLLSTITNSQTTTFGLPQSASGHIVVWAFNNIGSAPSTPLYIEPAPTVGMTSITYCSTNVRQCLHATWTTYSGAGFEKYELHRRTPGSAWTLAQTITAASTSAIADNGLTCGTTYEYKVIVHANGKTGESNVMQGNPNNGYGFCDQPTTTLNYVVYCSTNQKTCLKSGWSAYSGQGFEKYELQRRVGTSGEWAVAATITSASTTDHSDNGLTCGTTYNYRVVLYVAGGFAESNIIAGNPNNGFGGCY